MNKNNQKRIEKAIELYQSNQLDAAATLYRDIIQEQPDNAQLLNLLSTLHLQQHNYQHAIPLLKHSLHIDPDQPMCCLALATAYAAVGKLHQAAIQYKRYLATQPTDAKIINDTLSAIQYTRIATKLIYDPQQARQYLQQAIHLDPELAHTHIKLGRLLLQEDPDAAYTHLHEALAINPSHADVHVMLSIVEFDLADPSHAIQCLRNALTIDPNYLPALTQLAFLLQYSCAWEELKQIMTKVKADNLALAKQTKPAIQTPFMAMASVADSAYNYHVACAYSKRISARRHYYVNEPRKKTKRSKIRIGYLSGGFGNYPNSFLATNLFEHYNRDLFEVYIFSTSINDHSSYRQRIQDGCDKFFDLEQADDAAIACTIYENSVDILLELDGHVTVHKLGACAAKPAPIQMHYLGFPGTLGTDFIDYYIADPIVLPEHDQHYFQEKIIYLPHCYQINDANPEVSTKILNRQDFNLPTEQIVFCCFNQSYKIDETSFQTWMTILRAVPRSVLWLWEMSSMARHNLQQAASRQEIDPQRLIFSEHLPRPQHLVRLSLADLVLDTFVCNAHTTAADALWAGVPLITLQGTHFASRVASSMLTAIGLPELITHSVEEYRQLAIHLANNPAALAAIKTKLHNNRDIMPLFNSKQIIRHLEQAYQLAWNKYQSGEETEHIYVPSSF